MSIVFNFFNFHYTSKILIIKNQNPNHLSTSSFLLHYDRAKRATFETKITKCPLKFVKKNKSDKKVENI